MIYSKRHPIAMMRARRELSDKILNTNLCKEIVLSEKSTLNEQWVKQKSLLTKGVVTYQTEFGNIVDNIVSKQIAEDLVGIKAQGLEEGQIGYNQHLGAVCIWHAATGWMPIGGSGS